MRAYVGQTKAKKTIRKLIERGIGECTQPGEFPPRRAPWFLDNGAYLAFSNDAPWDEAAFVESLRLADAYEALPPDFVVAPDVVGGGLLSLRLSVEWRDRIRHPAYLAVQDGMAMGAIREVAPMFSGLFVGGTVEWKLATGNTWVRLAHSLGLPCHIGRVGTGKRVRWAADIGADSIDSSQPLWSKEHMRRFLDALDVGRSQAHMFRKVGT